MIAQDPPCGRAMTAETIPLSPIPAANVATVPQLSPLRYPGGKTWLIPHIRAWLGAFDAPPPLLLEPFAGGGIVSLTAAREGLAGRCLMVERDPDVAAFWRAALQRNAELRERVRAFAPTREAVEALAASSPQDVLERGFRTLVVNRARRGGILAPGAALHRSGENGKGVASRWYPETIRRRLADIAALGERIAFVEDDGMKRLEARLAGGEAGAVFIDPPYTASGKRAGRRLYAHNEIDHARLFALMAESRADFLMTYDLSPEILALAAKHRFHAVRVLMKTTHHARIAELLITRRPVFDRTEQVSPPAS